MSIRITESATLHPLVLPARADAGPNEAIRIYAEVRNRAIRDVAGRSDQGMTAEALLPVLRTTPTVTRAQWSIAVDDEIVGVAPLNILGDSDGKSAVLFVNLLRRAWGRGIGSAAFAELESVARSHGVERLLAWVEHPSPSDTQATLDSPTGYGSIPRDHHARFLLRHGYTLEQVERVSTLTWTDETLQRISALHAGAEEKAARYRVVQWMLPTPAEHIAGYAHMKAHMSTDAPDADLSMPAERWDADRVIRHDARYTQGGYTVLVTAAQHVATGELCAYNELSISPHPTATSHQEDTLVLSAHRGHRLGMLVKTAGLLSWRDQHPASPDVITYNAEENRPMLDINEAIGFAPISYEGAWKKDLT